jgi:hypothetical protein
VVAFSEDDRKQIRRRKISRGRYRAAILPILDANALQLSSNNASSEPQTTASAAISEARQQATRLTKLPPNRRWGSIPSRCCMAMSGARRLTLELK